jgi:hypothetical protein
MKQIVEVQIERTNSTISFKLDEVHPELGKLTWIGTDKTDIGKSVVLIYEWTVPGQEDQVNYRRVEYAGMPFILIFGDDIQPKMPN